MVWCGVVLVCVGVLWGGTDPSRCKGFLCKSRLMPKIKLILGPSPTVLAAQKKYCEKLISRFFNPAQGVC